MARATDDHADRRTPELALSDERAAAALFEEHRAHVYRIARGVTGDHELARDAVQETFLRVFRSLGGWKGESSLRTWITRIAVRCAVDLRRQAARQGSVCAFAREPSYDPRASLEDLLALQKVQQLAERLPGQQGLILRLRLLAGLCNREVAEALGLSEANVRMQLARAIRRLRELL